MAMVAVTKLDGTVVQNPNGIKNLYQELFYDDELKGVFERVDGELEFNNDGYDYIEALLLSQGMCSLIEFSLLINNKEYFDGLIHIPDITEMNLSRGLLKTPIADNNLSSYVFNNRNIRAYIGVPKSKNGDTITAATPINAYDFFTPTTGAYDQTRDSVYTVDSAFDFLVRFISDDAMTYSSPFFGTGGDGENMKIISGYALSKSVSTQSPFVSFNDLFTEMDKLFNLSMYIDFSGAKPELIIDKTVNLYTNSSILTISDAKDVIFRFDKERMFSVVRLGSEETQSSTGGFFSYPDSRFTGWKEEEYHVFGTCNMDRELDLVNKFILDSNIIEDILVNANNSYDEDTIVFEGGATQPTQYPFNAVFVYNLGLNNYQKTVNYFEGIPNDIVLFLDTDINNFEATAGSGNLPSGNFLHSTIVTNPSGNYSGVTGRFTCPPSFEGSYTFTFSYFDWSYSSLLPIGTNLGSVQIARYTSGGTLIETITLVEYTVGIDSPVIIDSGEHSGTFYLNAGEYVRLEGVLAGTGTVTFTLSNFKGVYSNGEGGIFQSYDINDYKAMTVEFEAPITITQFESLKNNVNKYVTVSTGAKVLQGWVKSIKRNILTGMTKFVLRASNRDNQKRNITR